MSYGLPVTTFWFRVYIDGPGYTIGPGQIIAGAWDSGGGVAQQTCAPLVTLSANRSIYTCTARCTSAPLPHTHMQLSLARRATERRSLALRWRCSWQWLLLLTL